MLYFKTAIFGIFVSGTVVGLVPYLIVSRWTAPAPEWWVAWHWLGWAPVAGGAAVLLWCARDFAAIGRGTPAPIDPPKRLIVCGLYRYVRNPMYVGVLSILAGEWLLYPSLPLLVYAAIIFTMLQAFVLFHEEPALRRKFGESYDAYCREVNRWLPRLRSTQDGFPRSRE